MFQAVEDHGKGKITAWVEKLINRCEECCHFVVERRKDSGERNPWHTYSDQLGKRALKKL